MSSGSPSAAAAQSLIHGYGDEFLLLASSLADALVQVDSKGVDLAPSQQDLLRILDGVTGLGAMIDQLLRAVPDAVPHLERRIAEMSGRATPDSDAAPPSPTKRIEVGDESLQPTSPADADEVHARVADAYAHLIDADGSEQVADEGDVDAPVQFAPRSAAGLARALQSLAKEAAPKRAPRGSAGQQAGAGASDPSSGAAGEAQAAQEAQEAQKAPEAPEVHEAPVETSALKGSNATMPLASVFEFIERVRKTGTLRIDLGDEQLTFGFGGGWVLSCRSSRQDQGDRVGDLLGGVCDRRALDQLLDSSEAMSMVQLGELVVRAGLATEGQMLNVLEQQVSVRYARACAAPEATYEFVEGPVGSSDGRLRIAPMELSFRGRTQASAQPSRPVGR